MTTVQQKTMRGDFLQFLYNISPSFSSEKAIVQAYFDYYKPEDIRRGLTYLVDSELIYKEVRQHPVHPLEKEVFYRIAPKGLDVVEGSDICKGVAVMPDKEV